MLFDQSLKGAVSEMCCLINPLKEQCMKHAV